MANQAPHRQALVLSCEVPDEEPLPGARYNAEKLSKFFRRANVPSGFSYGSRLTLDRAKEDINHLFSIESDLHILYGIFHGHAGSWKLSDGTTLGLRGILEQWDLAKELGTARHLLIVSDACESGQMVNEADRIGRTDIAVQASCAGSNETRDMEGETFTELLLWKLQGKKMMRWRDERICDIETALLNFGPCYYCPDRSNYRGWIFVDEDGSDQSSQCFSLKADSSDMTSHVSSAEPDDAHSPEPDNIGRTDNASNQEASRIAWNYEKKRKFRMQAVFFSFWSLATNFLANCWILLGEGCQLATAFHESAFFCTGGWLLHLAGKLLLGICRKHWQWLVQNKRSIALRALPVDTSLQIPPVAPNVKYHSVLGRIEKALQGFLDVLLDSMVFSSMTFTVHTVHRLFNLYKLTRHALRILQTKTGRNSVVIGVLAFNWVTQLQKVRKNRGAMILEQTTKDKRSEKTRRL